MLKLGRYPPKEIQLSHLNQVSNIIAFHADFFRGSSLRFLPHERLLSRVVKFFSHCVQIPVGAHVQIIGEPIGAVEVKV